MIGASTAPTISAITPSNSNSGPSASIIGSMASNSVVKIGATASRTEPITSSATPRLSLKSSASTSIRGITVSRASTRIVPSKLIIVVKGAIRG